METRILHTSTSGADDQIGRIGRRFDLVVVGQPPRKNSLPDEVVDEGVLFESGRPVVFVPFIQKGGMKADRVMVCWDGSRAAARAVADAMPFLKKAKQIEIVIISDKAPKKDEVPGADLGQHLARHGLKVDVKRITAPDTDVPSTNPVGPTRTLAQRGRDLRVAFLLVPFLWRRKEKELGRR